MLKIIKSTVQLIRQLLLDHLRNDMQFKMI